MLFGITDSSWFFSQSNDISIKEIETVEIDHEDYSEKIFFDRKEDWIKVEYDLSQ